LIQECQSGRRVEKRLVKEYADHGSLRQIFGPCPLSPNGWMDQDVTWYGDRPGLDPGHFVLNGDRAAPRKEHNSPQIRFGFTLAGRAACFRKPRLMCIVVKRSPISATAELLYSRTKINARQKQLKLSLAGIQTIDEKLAQKMYILL